MQNSIKLMSEGSKAIKVGKYIILPCGPALEASFRLSQEDRLMGKTGSENPDEPWGRRQIRVPMMD